MKSETRASQRSNKAECGSRGLEDSNGSNSGRRGLKKMAFMTLIVPGTYDLVMPKLRTSAVAAALTCTGLSDGSHCGTKWYTQSWDGTDSLENQMAVLGVLNANLVPFKNKAPFTADTGGTSQSNPSAGTNSSDVQVPQLDTVRTGDRAGAGILTVVFVTGWAVAITWMIRGG